MEAGLLEGQHAVADLYNFVSTNKMMGRKGEREVGGYRRTRSRRAWRAVWTRTLLCGWHPFYLLFTNNTLAWWYCGPLRRQFGVMGNSLRQSGGWENWLGQTAVI